MRAVAGFVLAILTALVTPSRAEACSIVQPLIHERDPAHAGDTTPPSATTVTAVAVQHSDGGGCCGGPRTWVDLDVVASDDATPADRLAYKLAIVGGDPPALGTPLPQTVVVEYGGRVFFYVDGDQPFAFDLEVRAVDLNGNAGPPVVVAVEHRPADGGCTAGRPVPLAGVLVIALALLLALRRRANPVCAKTVLQPRSLVGDSAPRLPRQAG